MTNFFEAASRHRSIKQQKQFFRLYYNDAGQPTAYSMEDLPGKYIVIDQKTYAEGRKDVIIKGGKVIKLNSLSAIYKMVPADEGTECDAEDITIIGEGQHWKLKKYETD